MGDPRHPQLSLLLTLLTQAPTSSLHTIHLQPLLILLTRLRQNIQQPLLHTCLPNNPPSLLLTRSNNIRHIPHIRNILLRIQRDRDPAIASTTTSTSNAMDVAGA